MQRREFNLAALASVLAAQGLAAGTAQAQNLGTLKMMIPANPGGGWDQTGRNLAVAMQSAGVISGAQFENKGGAGGTLGLAQFINNAKGDGNSLMIGGMVMVGGIILSKSSVDLTMVTPIARLTSEYGVIVVPASSPHKTLKRPDDCVQGQSRRGIVGRRFGGRHGPHPRRPGGQGGRRGHRQDQLRALQGRRRSNRRYHRRPRHCGRFRPG